MMQDSRRGGSVVFALVVVVLLSALAVEAYILLRPKPAIPEAARRAIASSSNKVITFGQTSAPIEVELYAPLTLEWHQKTIGLLREYDKAHPGRIHVTLMPMGNPDCQAEIEKRGHTCAVVFVNGKSEYTLPGGKTVRLEKNPNASYSTYSSEDVISILVQLSKKV